MRIGDIIHHKPSGEQRLVVRACENGDIIAALFVESGGCYFGLPNVVPFDAIGQQFFTVPNQPVPDARQYNGPWPVVAHPPCQRWGRFWHGSTRKPHQFNLGDDGGCFVAALAAVRKWGGVLEHPADSHAWAAYSIPAPKRGAGWLEIGNGDWTCYVEQGNYGHFSRKPTWLFYHGPRPFDLDWTIGEQRLDPRALERYGYEKARRIGSMSWIGGRNKTRIRNATPHLFRDVLLSLASNTGLDSSETPEQSVGESGNEVK